MEIESHDAERRWGNSYFSAAIFTLLPKETKIEQ